MTPSRTRDFNYYQYELSISQRNALDNARYKASQERFNAWYQQQDIKFEEYMNKNPELATRISQLWED